MSKNLKTTGERLIPDDMQTPVEQMQKFRHLFVYYHLKNILNKEFNVLEIGTGEGYGTAMLANSCKKITGIDVDKNVVEYSNVKYGQGNCSFLHYDGTKIPFNDDTFDIAISFQVIEHVVDDVNFISEAARILKKGGSLYLTTPNKITRLKPGQKPWNRYHIREYSQIEMADLLKRCFSEVDVFGVGGTELVHRMEANRIKQGFIIALALRMGIRKLLPETLDAKIARFVSKSRSGKNEQPSEIKQKHRFSTDDFHIEKENVDNSLDLFARATK